MRKLVGIIRQFSCHFKKVPKIRNHLYVSDLALFYWIMICLWFCGGPEFSQEQMILQQNCTYLTNSLLKIPTQADFRPPGFQSFITMLVIIQELETVSILCDLGVLGQRNLNLSLLQTFQGRFSPALDALYPQPFIKCCVSINCLSPAQQSNT